METINDDKTSFTQTIFCSNEIFACGQKTPFFYCQADKLYQVIPADLITTEPLLCMKLFQLISRNRSYVLRLYVHAFVTHPMNHKNPLFMRLLYVEHYSIAHDDEAAFGFDCITDKDAIPRI